MDSVSYEGFHTQHTRIRHTRASPCPVCGGGDDDPRGSGKRCYGFTAGDRCYCTNAHVNHGNAKRNEKANAWVHFLGERTAKSPGGQPIYYVYHAADGTPLFRVGRKGQKPNKHYFQEHPTESGWVKGGIPEAQRVLYRLPELLQAPNDALVFIPEGEKCVDSLRRAGLVATCNAGGAGKWLAQYNEPLRGRQVVILPDNDGPDTTPPYAGQKHALQVARALAGVAASVKLVELPGLPSEGDVYDYFAAGGTKAQLLALVEAAPEWQPGQEEEAQESNADSLLAKLVFSLDDLLLETFPPVKWAVDGIIPEGLTVFAGKPKVGKSWMMLAIALAVAYGEKALGQIRVERGDVLYLALEDRKKRLQNRARKIGALRGKCGRFHLAVEWPRLGEGGKELLERWIQAHPNARLIVIDTLAKIKPRVNVPNGLYDADYQSLEPLQALSQQYSIPIVVVTHLRKLDAEDAFDAINASLGLNGAADNLVVIKKQRGKADALLCGVGREGDDFEKVVRFDAATCLWTLQGDAETYVPTEERRRILDVLTNAAPKALTPKEIALQMDAEANNVTQLLYKLKLAGQVICPGYGKYTIPNNVDKSDKTDAPDQATFDEEVLSADEDIDKTLEADKTGSEEVLSDNDVDKSGDKTFEGAAPDVDGTLTTLTTLIDVDDVVGEAPLPVEDERPTGARLKATIQGWQVDPGTLHDAQRHIASSPPPAPSVTSVTPPLDAMKQAIMAWAGARGWRAWGTHGGTKQAWVYDLMCMSRPQVAALYGQVGGEGD